MTPAQALARLLHPGDWWDGGGLRDGWFRVKYTAEAQAILDDLTEAGLITQVTL